MITTIDGTISAVSGATPGPASGIAYTIKYNDNGSVIELSQQVPVMRQWPDEIDTDGAAQIGTKAFGFMTEEGRIWWFFQERPVIQDCEAPAPIMMQDPEDPLKRIATKAPPKSAPTLPGFGSTGDSTGADV